MRQIAYTSVATTELRQDDVFRIVEKSVGNNMGRGVTGFLIYAKDRFFQLIEGEEAALRGLLATLQTDPRHREICIVLDTPISAPRFPRWRMQRVGRSSDELGEVRASLGTDANGQQVLRQLDRFLAQSTTPELIGK